MKSFAFRLISLVVAIGLGLAIVGVSAAILAVVVAAHSGGFANAESMLNDSTLLLGSQWLQTIFLMFLPGIVWAWLVLKENPFKTFHFDRFPAKAVLIAVVFTLVMFPAEEWFILGANSIPWPESIQRTIDNSAVMQAVALTTMIGGDSILSIINIVLLMSVCTGIAEETMFRGAIYKLFSQKANVHVNALLVGLIFAIIHFEYTGFLFRWFLGTAYVYMVYYSGSIWPSICAHATNNLVAFIGMRLFPLPDNFLQLGYYEQLEAIHAQNEPMSTPVIAVVSLIATVGIAYYFIKNSDKFQKKSEEIAVE